MKLLNHIRTRVALHCSLTKACMLQSISRYTLYNDLERTHEWAYQKWNVNPHILWMLMGIFMTYTMYDLQAINLDNLKHHVKCLYFWQLGLPLHVTTALPFYSDYKRITLTKIKMYLVLLAYLGLKWGPKIHVWRLSIGKKLHCFAYVTLTLCSAINWLANIFHSWLTGLKCFSSAHMYF